MSASAVAVMVVHDSSAKMQPHTLHRLLRASSTGNAASLAAMGSSSPSITSPSASLSPPAAAAASVAATSFHHTASASSPPSATSVLSSSPPSSSVATAAATAIATSSPSTRSRSVSLRSRFSPGHIRISIASRHAAQRDSASAATRIKEEGEEDGREERKSGDEDEASTDSHYSAVRRINHSSHASSSTASTFSIVAASSASSGLPAARSRLQLSQLRPSIHTASRDAPRKASLLSASPAITPSSTSPRSSFLPTTRPHAHSLSFTTSRLSQHPEDVHHAAAGVSSSSSLHSRRNSLSRYTPIGNEEQRGRDVDESGAFSGRSPHLFSPTTAASPTAAGLPSAAALSMTAAARPTSAGSWRHRRPQSLTAPFSSNAITATTVTGSALSSVGSSAQLSSAQSVSPSLHTVTFPSATPSASHTPTPSSSTSSPPSSSNLPPSLSASASFAHSSTASRIVSPLMTSLSPSLISALIHVNEPSHHAHSHTIHVHTALPAAETIQEETPSPSTAQLTRSSGKEERREERRQPRMRKKGRRPERKQRKQTEESKECREEEETKADCDERKEDIASSSLPVPQRTVSMPTPLSQPTVPRSPPTPQFIPPLPVPPRWPVTATSPPPPPPPLPPPPPPPLSAQLGSHFGPLLAPADLSGAGPPPIRLAMRGRSAGSIMLVAAGGEYADEADRVDDAVNGRRGSMPLSHHKDWASLTAIQHISAVTVKLGNQP